MSDVGNTSRCYHAIFLINPIFDVDMLYKPIQNMKISGVGGGGGGQKSTNYQVK